MAIRSDPAGLLCQNADMRALVLTANKVLEVLDRETPVAGPGELLVSVAACGICGSDVHGYDGSSGRRIPPLIMGHEAAGVVAETGPGVTRFRNGDRITFDSTIYCGKCRFCRIGEVNLCDQREVLGVSCGEYRRNGAFAEFVVVPERIAFQLPDSMPFPEAALLEPAAVGLHAVSLSPTDKRDTALIIGAGMIGLLTIQAARFAGFERVFIADIDASRLELAKSLGATDTLHAGGSDLVQRIHEITDGLGVDVVFEAVGRAETVSTAIDAARKSGTVLLIGNVTPAVKLPLQKVVSRQIRLQGTAASAGEYPKAIEAIARGALRVAPLISAVAPLASGPEWFERLYAGEPGLMKIVLAPGGTDLQ
jgi:L-iditol 2-dehydrogenase